MTLALISVDTPQTSIPWAEKKGFTFPMLSDPDMEVIKGWGLQNKDVPDLALHAVYILDPDGTIFYRKVARRRAYSQEFLDAIDFHLGDWTPSEERG